MLPSPVGTFFGFGDLRYAQRDCVAPFRLGPHLLNWYWRSNECQLYVFFGFWVTKVFRSFAWGPLWMSLGDQNNAQRLNVALQRLGPHSPGRS